MSNNKLPSLPAGKLPISSLSTLQEMVKDVSDYLKVAEVEETKRTDIRARSDVALEAVRSRRDMIMKAMEHTFGERAAVLNKQFDVLDQALASGNAQLAIQSMNSMTDLVKSSPLRALQDVQLSLEKGSFDL